MPGLGFSQLSSNWKILQGRLQAEKNKNGSHAVKRKREAGPNEQSNGHKKTKFTKSISKPRVPKRKMGSTTSKQYANETTSPPHQESTKQNGPPQPTDTLNGTPQDEINTGLHPTNHAGKYIALDCEMVGTGPPPHLDNLLARVSVVNYHGHQLYDSYVLPPPKAEVTDYRTWISGIKEEHLQSGVARPLSEVQEDVAKSVKGRVVVGHALRNDWAVLGFQHPRRDVRDTARYEGFRKNGFGAPSLRKLAKDVLGLEIQGGEHSSLEDARAAMALFRAERVGFEGESRKRFGAPRGVGKGGKVQAVVVDDEERDVDLLEREVDANSDEEDGEAEVEGARNPMFGAKKKRKKKKRTKRK